MKIINLKAENFKKLEAVDITPDGSMVMLTGANAQGKSSVLDAIWATFSGRFAKSVKKPIKDGADKAKVTVTTDKYIITRSFTDAGVYLKVENQDGAQFKSAQSLIDSLIGDVTMDPLDFLDRKPAEQVDTLLNLVKLKIDPREIDAKVKALFDERTAIGRDGKTAKGHLETLTPPAPDTPDEEFKASDVLADIEAAQKVIDSNAEKRGALFSLRTDASGIETEIERLLAQVEALRDAYTVTQTRIEAMQSEVEALVDPDIESLKAKLSTVEDTNRAVRAKAEFSRAAQRVEELREAYDAKTTEIDKLKQKKAAALSAAKFPVKGLSIDENDVVYNGIPLDQSSSAEQLRVSMAVAMALSPELKVIHIKDGSLLDSQSMKIVNEMAEANDYQVWIERVDESGKVGFYIEDGNVTAVNGEAAA